MTSPMRCARCRRRLAKPAAIVAGMPMGPDCARALGVALGLTSLQEAADRRRTSEHEADFAARQLTFLEA